MDKVEYQIRLDQIKLLLKEQEYEEAMEVCDTIDWKKVKNTSTLCTVSEIYKINRRYEDARDIVLMAYDRHPEAKNLVYSLCELSIKLGEFVTAVKYFNEFKALAPKDPSAYILQYRIYEIQEVPIEERIEVLEAYKKADYRERWAYELAYLYHQIGEGEKCAAECDELILWFGEGKYVEKALELKQMHKPLTRSQQEKYDFIMMEAEAMYAQEEAEADEEYAQEDEAGEEYPEDDYPRDEEYPEDSYPEGEYSDEEYPDNEEAAEREYEESGYGDDQYEDGYAESGYEDGQYEGEYAEPEYNAGEEYAEAEYEDAREESVSGGSIIKPDFEKQYTQELEPVPDENGMIPTVADEDAIKVKEIGVGKFSTINLQAELSANVRQFIEDIGNRSQDEDGYEEGTETSGDSEDEIVPGADISVMADEEESEAVILADAVGDEDSEVYAEAEDGEAEQAAADSYGITDGGETEDSEAEDSEFSEASDGEAAKADDVKVYNVRTSETEAQETEAQETEAERNEALEEPRGESVVLSAALEKRRRQKELQEKPAVRIHEPQNHIPTRKADTAELPSPGPMLKRVPRAESRMNQVLSQDSDGQLSMVMPERQAVEKQITGQIDVYSYMESWDKERKEKQRLRIANAKRKSLEQTNDIVSELEAVMPHVTGPIPAVEELAKDVKLPEEMDSQETEAMMEDLYENGLIDESERRRATDIFDTSQIPVDEFATGHIPGIDVPEPVYEKNIYAGEDYEEYPEDGYPEGEYPEEGYPEGENPGEEYSEDGYETGAEQKRILSDDTSQIPVDEFSTGHIPGIDVPAENEYNEEYGQEGYADEEYAQEGYAGEEYGQEGYADDDYAQDGYADEDEEYSMDEYEREDYGVAAASGHGSGYTEDLSEVNRAGRSDYVGEADFDDDYFDIMDFDSPGYDIYPEDEEEVPEEEYEDEAVYAQDGVTDELEELFGEYLGLRNMRKKLNETLENISMVPVSGNVIITGNVREVRLSIASGIARYLQRKDMAFTGKVAKIPAATLNAKDVRKAVAAINNGALVIEKAGDLEINTLDTLAKCINHSNVKVLIILEDEKSEMRRVAKLRSYFAKLFDIKLEVPVYSNDDLVNHAKKYALDREYFIDEMGVLALYTRIAEMQTANHFVTVNEVEEIMEKAFESVDKKSLTHFGDILFARRYNDDDLTIIRERDFIK